MSELPDYDPSAFPPFAVTVDIVVLTIVDDRLQVVLIERGAPPFQGALAIPGGFVRIDEDLDTAATRELIEETGLDYLPQHLEQFGVYGQPGRDPRMRVVSVGYVAFLPEIPIPEAGTDAADAYLVAVDDALTDPGGLAFDHHVILTDAVEHARRSLESATTATAFLPPVFTVTELRGVYETVWGTSLDPGNFQKKVIDSEGFVIATGELRQGPRGRPAELYRAGPAETIDPPIRR